MIDFKAHKDLLTQITNLEKNSVNYFDVEKEFFLIDSENLTEVKTKFYGYSIQRTGIYDEDNLTEEAVKGLDGRGYYVYVEVNDGEITIKQDLNGSYGIFLFRNGDYFALSNSFFRLLDHVKFRYPLTVNKDVCSHLCLEPLYSNAYSETAVNEISILDRSAICHINIAKKILEIELYDYKEHSLFLDSEKAITTLDDWMNLWGGVFRGVAKNTKFISADLTGGFDSRIAFNTLLNSGIDLNQIQVRSVLPDNLYSHNEDYAIATQITDSYGCKLNQPLPNNPSLNYSLADIFNFNLYIGQTFTTIPAYYRAKNVSKIYCLKGFGGETVRSYYERYNSLGEFIVHQLQQFILPFNFSQGLAQKLADSIAKIDKSSFQSMAFRHGIENDPKMILQYFCVDLLSRYHFGKQTGMVYCYGGVHLSPILDPLLRKVHYATSDFKDYNLLMALIHTRYQPKLLTFPFNAKKFIHPETLALAQQINDRFPPYIAPNKDKIKNEVFNLQPRNLQVEKVLATDKNNPPLPSDLPERCLKAVFESSKTYGLFTTYFEEELFNRLSLYYETPAFKFTRLRPMYSAYGVARVIEDVQISQQNQKPYRDMQRFLEQDFCQINDPNSSEYIEIGRKVVQDFISRNVNKQ